MNSNHKNGEGNGTLHDDLEQITRAYKSIEQQEPPELLDQAVINSAHRAVEKKPGWMQFGWLHGLSTAAVIVLAISLILQQRETSPVLEDSIGTNIPAPLQSQKAVEKPSFQLSSEPSDSVTEKDDDSHARQKRAMPASPPAMENKAMPPEKAQSQESSDEPIASAGKIAEEEVAEYRVDTDNKELPVNRSYADKGDSVTDVVAKEVSHETAGVAVRVDQLQNELTIDEQLANIIRLKNAGDESWQTELRAFKQRNPDYPIPQELEP